MSPAAGARLQAVADAVGERIRAGGVAATCTWSKGRGLLDGWRRLATIRLTRERTA